MHKKKKKKRILIPLGFFFLVMNGLFALIYAGVILLLELELIFPILLLIANICGGKFCS